MDQAYSSSSSSSAYLNMQEKSSKLPCYAASLHSVRKSPAKPWKKPVAPLPPTPPRVYKVDPVNFRDLVQKLTAAPEFLGSRQPLSPRRLHTKAPPPVDVGMAAPALALVHRPSPAKAASLSTVYKEFSEVLLEKKPHHNHHQMMMMMKGSSDHHGMGPSSSSFLGLNLSSPSSSSSHNWCSFPLLSPGTLSSLEQSTVL